MDRIDHFHAFGGVAHNFLGELLVVKAGDAAADQKRVALLFNVPNGVPSAASPKLLHKRR